MNLSALSRKNIRTVLKMSLLGSVVAFVWGLYSGFGIQMAMKFHVSMGFLASFIIASTELFVLDQIAYRLHFLFLLLIRTFLYVFVIFLLLIVLVPLTGLVDLGSPMYASNNIHSRGIVFGTIVSFVLSLIHSLQRILGTGMLTKLFVGNYHRPAEQQRIFMFLDVTSSTSIAEKIGHQQFMLLLNDFYYNISSAIIVTNGEIYKYVGDEVIVTWTMGTGIQNANCIQCYFQAVAAIERNRSLYLAKYGFVPEFRAGIHGGTVVAGLLGADKAEIAYLGDVLNTTSRIQAECRELNRPLLVSGNILERMTLPTQVSARHVEGVKLRGKEQQVELYSVEIATTIGR